MTKVRKMLLIKERDPMVIVNHHKGKHNAVIFIDYIKDPNTGLEKTYNTTAKQQKQAVEDLNYIMWSMNIDSGE